MIIKKQVDETLSKYHLRAELTFKDMREQILKQNMEEIVGRTRLISQNTWADANSGGLRLIKMQLSAFALRSKKRICSKCD